MSDSNLDGGFSVSFEDFDKKFQDIMKNTIPDLADKAQLEMAKQLLNDATTQEPTVPKGHARAKAGKRTGVGGTLRQSGKIVKQEPGHYKVGFNMPYATYQHEGQRKDGSHIVRNYSEAGAGKKFLTKKIQMNRNVYLKKMANFIKAGGS